MKDKLIGAFVGVLIALITLFIQINTPLFSSKVRMIIDEPPIFNIIETKQTSKYYEVLFEGKFLVKNYGFKSGSLSKALLASKGLREIPKIKIISIYRGDIQPFDTQWATINAIVYFDYDNLENKGFIFEFYDEYDDYIGKIENVFSTKPIKNVPVGGQMCLVVPKPNE